MNFSWFASAYDTDDVPYRVAVLVQMAGVLVVAVGIPRALGSRDFAVMVTGYVIMRMAMVGLWLRAAVSDAAGRQTALRYAAGITVVQVGWVAWFFFVPRDVAVWVFLVLVAAELLVPVFAEAAGRTAWHPGHIAERYGAFTIIVLGEAISAGTLGVNAALEKGTTFLGPGDDRRRRPANRFLDVVAVFRHAFGTGRGVGAKVVYEPVARRVWVGIWALRHIRQRRRHGHRAGDRHRPGVARTPSSLISRPPSASPCRCRSTSSWPGPCTLRTSRPAPFATGVRLPRWYSSWPVASRRNRCSSPVSSSPPCWH